VRTVLANAIAQDPLALAHFTPDAADAGHAVYHQRHQELQRQMAQRVGALRDQVRKAVSAVSPQLRQLALLDATFEELLAAREDALLPTTTHLLEMIHPRTLVVNDPFWVRNSPEKLLVLRFPSLTPPPPSPAISPPSARSRPAMATSS